MMVSQWWERKVTKKKHRKNIRSFPNDKKPNEQIINLIELRIVSTGWETKGSKEETCIEPTIVSTWLETKGTND